MLNKSDERQYKAEAAFMQDSGEVLKCLSSDKKMGLTGEQAAENGLRYGTNNLTRKKKASFLKRLWDAATEPMLIMLFAAAFIALFANVYREISSGNGDFLECIGVFAAISVSIIISMVMEGKSSKAFEELSKISNNITVRAVRDGKDVVLAQSDIVCGDVVILSGGDKIPADCRLISATGLFVDESSLTGESHPVSKEAEVVFCDAATPLAERQNMIYRGTYITEGHCRAVVVACGDNTEFGKIAKEIDRENNESTPLQEKLARLGKLIAVLGVVAAGVVFVAELVSFFINGTFTANNILEAFLTSITLIVAAVPEGLPTIVAVSLSINTIKLARQNALVKKMIASETVGCINVICSDKTGTLTENKMTVRGFFGEENMQSMLLNICVNTTADIGENGEFIGNASECAMLNFYKKIAGADEKNEFTDLVPDYRQVREKYGVLYAFPFSSNLKHMTTIADIKECPTSFVKGSPECVLDMCSMSDEKREDICKRIEEAQKKAMRVIAFAHKRLDKEAPEGGYKVYEDEVLHERLEDDMCFDGFVAIADPIRRDVYEAVKTCKKAGIDLKILTGDNLITAKSIAEELGAFDKGGVAVTARGVDEMSDDDLRGALPEIRVIARSTPEVKLRVVNLLKSMGDVVAVTGDGINDAPAIKSADVGIAMGINGTEVSKEASDIVLLDDSFATIVKAIGWGRNIFENFKRFISFQLTVNIAAVVVVMVSVLTGGAPPFTTIQLLWINIIMDGPPALTLGLEAADTDLLKDKPVKRGANIISRSMAVRIGVTSAYMAAIFLLQYKFNFLSCGEGETGSVLFSMFVFFQLFNAINCRKLNGASCFRGIYKNKAMILTLAVTFAIQIVIVQFAGGFLGMNPLTLLSWIKITAMSFSVILISELIKLFARTRKA